MKTTATPVPPPARAAASALRPVTETAVLEADAGDAFAFLADPANMPRWSRVFCRGIERRGGEWIADTTWGPMVVRIDADARTGVVDHLVGPNAQELARYPARVVALAPGRTLFTFTMVPQPGETAAAFAQGLDGLRREIEYLRQELGEPAPLVAPGRERERA